MIHYYHFFFMSNVPGLASGSPSKLAHASFVHPPTILEALSCFLVQDTFHSFYTFPASDVKSALSSRSSGSPLWRLIFRIQELSSRCVHCPGVPMLSGLPGTEMGLYTYVCSNNIHVHIHAQERVSSQAFPMQVSSSPNPGLIPCVKPLQPPPHSHLVPCYTLELYLSPHPPTRLGFSTCRHLPHPLAILTSCFPLLLNPSAFCGGTTDPPPPPILLCSAPI